MERDPFAQADDLNAKRAAMEALLRLQHERTARRQSQPLPEGGLFDEVRRGQQEMF